MVPVTQDVDEAVVLTDRVLLMTGGLIEHELDGWAGQSPAPERSELRLLSERLLARLGIEAAV